MAGLFDMLVLELEGTVESTSWLLPALQHKAEERDAARSLEETFTPPDNIFASEHPCESHVSTQTRFHVHIQCLLVGSNLTHAISVPAQGFGRI